MPDTPAPRRSFISPAAALNRLGLLGKIGIFGIAVALSLLGRMDGTFTAGLAVLSDTRGGYPAPVDLSPEEALARLTRAAQVSDLLSHPSGALSDAQVSEFIAGFPSTPFADTLARVLGRASVSRDAVGASVAAVFLTAQDKIILTDRPGVFSTAFGIESTIAHEMAHVWQSRQGAFLGEIWDSYDIKPPVGYLAGYSSTSRSEHQANAVSAAFTIIRLAAFPDTAFSHRASLIKYISEREPGSMILARMFLTHPAMAGYKVDPGLLPGVPLSPLSPPYAWKPSPSSLPGRARTWSMLQASAPGALGHTVRWFRPSWFH